MTTHTEIPIAGIAWPMYKVLALILGALVFVVVGAVIVTAGPAVLAGAGTAPPVAERGPCRPRPAGMAQTVAP